MYNLLFYGDSNTWGFNPRTGRRYPYEVRWTSICARLLGDDFNCIPAGMNGRSTIFDDPIKGSRNGIKGLDYELQTHKPLDLFVVMLGTNDLKYTDAKGSAFGLERLIKLVLTANERYSLTSPVFLENIKPAILIITPADISSHVGTFQNDVEESHFLKGYYEQLAKKYGTYYMDASQYTTPSTVDGVHLDIDGHEKLGKAVANKILSIFANVVI